jgi:hypothetical protein
MSTIEHGRCWFNESPKFLNDTKTRSFFRRGERYAEKLHPDHVKNLPNLITNELKKLIAIINHKIGQSDPEQNNSGKITNKIEKLLKQRAIVVSSL